MSNEYFDGSPLPGTTCPHPESEILMVRPNPTQKSWTDPERPGNLPVPPLPKQERYCQQCKRFLMGGELSDRTQEGKLFEVLDGLCAEMSERTGNPWGYNKDQWRQAIREADIQATQAITKAPDYNERGLNEVMFGNGDGSMPIYERAPELDGMFIPVWTCDNHPPGLEVSVPLGKKCPVCGRMES